MAVAKQIRKCPYCRETIPAEASKCKYCHSEISEKKSAGKSFWAANDTFRTGFLAGVLFSLLMAVLIYLQFSS